jgi:hypothetical protein
MDACSLGSNPQGSVCSQYLSHLASFPFVVVLPGGTAFLHLDRSGFRRCGRELYRTAVTEFSVYILVAWIMSCNPEDEGRSFPRKCGNQTTRCHCPEDRNQNVVRHYVYIYACVCTYIYMYIYIKVTMRWKLCDDAISGYLSNELYSVNTLQERKLYNRSGTSEQSFISVHRGYSVSNGNILMRILEV